MGEGSPTPTSSRRLGLGLRIAGGVAILLLLTHEFLLTVFLIHGISMEPTLRSGQRVLVLRALPEVRRGDLVVFKNPVHPSQVLLKRVLALPGEEITSVGGKVLVGGFELGEPYVKPGTTAGNFAPTLLGKGAYYVVGDNRAESVDSRKFGEIERRLILGKVVFTLW